MKTPEEIALIGGGILLSSGLVFGLKSGAASELPNVERSVGTVLQGSNSSAPNDTNSNSSTNQESAQQQQADKFNDGFQQAQQKGWQTGDWGSAKFYVDDNENMHVGSGQLSGSYSSVVDSNEIKTINLDGAVQAPQDSSLLFARNDYGSTPLAQINGLSNLDTSSATNMSGMFNDDSKLSSLDLSHFDTHNVTDMNDMFMNDNNLTSLDFSHFNTSNVTDMEDMFDSDSSLSNLDLSHFDTSKVTNMTDMFDSDSSLSNLDLSHFDISKVTDVDYMFYGANVQQLTLGSNTKLQNNPNNSSYDLELSGTFQNNGQTLNLDGNAHPGTWYKQ